MLSVLFTLVRQEPFSSRSWYPSPMSPCHFMAGVYCRINLFLEIAHVPALTNMRSPAIGMLLHYATAVGVKDMFPSQDAVSIRACLVRLQFPGRKTFYFLHKAAFYRNGFLSLPMSSCRLGRHIFLCQAAVLRSDMFLCKAAVPGSGMFLCQDAVPGSGMFLYQAAVTEEIASELQHLERDMSAGKGCS